MSQDQDTGRELSGGTMLRYALVGIGLLCAAVVGQSVFKTIAALRSMGGGVTAKAEWSSAPGPKRRKDPYR